MSIITWLIVGIIIGWSISLLLRDIKKDEAWDIVTGAFGAVATGFLVNILTQQELTAFHWYSVPLAIVGAVIIIWFEKLWIQTM